MGKKTSSSRKRSRPVSKKKKQIDKNMIILAGIVVVIVVAIAGVLLIGDGGDQDTNTDDNIDTGDNPVAVIDTTKGIIEVELYADKAPSTVDNFVTYANEGFYDGLVFHRVIDGFMIQGGGFYPDGTQKETNEPIDLEIHPDASHVDGAIAMARTSDPNSATSQFFIDDGAQSQLEPGGVDANGYAVFGVVVDGMDVVRSISSVETTTKNNMQDWPVEDVIINSVTIEQQ